MSKATIDKLDDLHEALATELSKRLTAGEKIVTKDGEGNVVVTEVGCSAATLAQVRQFLKDNNIEASAASKRMRNLVENLPFPGETPEDLPGVTH